MRDILKKAQQRAAKKTTYIAINHLSPNRNLRHFQEREDIKVNETQGQFSMIENELRTKVSLIENEAVQVESITDD